MLSARRLLLCCSLVIVSGAVQAQERRTGGPPPYDPAKELSVSGVVVGLETITPPDLPTQAVLVLSVEDGSLGIFMGPADWLAKQNLTFATGATVQVVGMTGYRYNGNPAMTPRTVKVGNRTLALRDATGTPLWEGGN